MGLSRRQALVGVTATIAMPATSADALDQDSDLSQHLVRFHSLADVLETMLQHQQQVFDETMAIFPNYDVANATALERKQFQNHMHLGGYDDSTCDTAIQECYEAFDEVLRTRANSIAGVAAKLEAIIRANPSASQSLQDGEGTGPQLSNEEWLSLVSDIRHLAQTAF